MKILRSIFKRPVTMVLMIIVIIAIGVFSTSSMAINLLPDISFPYLSIETVYVGADAETVDKDITIPMENALDGDSDLRNIQTYSVDNASILILQYEYGTSLDDKKKDIEDKLSSIDLPSDASTPEISDIDLNSTSIFTLSLYSDTEDMSYLYTVAKDIENELSSISGVASTSLTGAPTAAIKVDMINGLEPFVGLIVQELAYDASYDIPLGDIKTKDGSISVNNDSSAKTVEAIKNLNIGIELSDEYISTLTTIKKLLAKLDSINSNDLMTLYAEVSMLKNLIDSVDKMNSSELESYVDDLALVKSFMSLLNDNSSDTLKSLYDDKIKDIVSDANFKNLSKTELYNLADSDETLYEVLKYAQNNLSDFDSVFNKLITYRGDHTGELENKDYVNLLYTLNVYSSDPSSSNYQSETYVGYYVTFYEMESLKNFRTALSKKKSGESLSNSDYCTMFDLSGMTDEFSLSPLLLKILRSDNLGTDFNVLYEYKKNHEHEEQILNNVTGEYETEIAGDPISTEDLSTLISSMKLDDLGFSVTERLIEFIKNVELINNTVSFKIADACDVYQSNEYESRAYYNSKEAIKIDLYGASGSNATSISKSAQKIIEEYNNKESLNAHVVMLNNQADFINDSLSNALVSLLIGMVLAVIVIYLFLRKIKSSLIIAVSMPLSVLLTIACLYLMGITLNMVSVGGIAVGIGMLVDNSIVVLESITSEKQKGKDVYTASVDGVKLVLGSLIGSTLTSICVFFPILFINGLTKEIFSDLAWAVIYSLSFSLLVAVFVIPTLFCFFYKNEKEESKKENHKFFNKFKDGYSKLLEKCLKRRWTTVLSCFGIFLLSILLIFTCSIEFLPSIDQGKIKVSIPFTSGDSNEYCQEETEEAYNIISSNLENIEYMSVSVGYANLIKTNQSGTITIQLNDDAEDTSAVVENVREILENNNYDHDFSVTEIDGVVATLVGSMSGVSVSLEGEDTETLKEIASKIEADVINKKGIKRASDDMLSTSESYKISFDMEKLILNGVEYTDVVKTLRIGLSGYDVSTISVDDNEYSVTVGWNDNVGDYYGDIGNIVIGINDNGFVKLSDCASIEKQSGRHIIRKENGLNLLSVTIESYGIDTNTASKELQASAKEVLKDYPGYSYSSGGVSSYLTDAFTGLVKALIISFFLLFMVMACLFESFKKPVLIILSFPFAFTGGFIALAITQVGLNVVSFIGLIMLMGVVINNAIVLNERIDQLIESGLDKKKAVIEGCRERIRAVLMTSLTTILALIPMALGIGKGGELMQPLGVVAIGGMLIGTCVTLILIPALYSLFYKIKYDKNTVIYTGENYLDVTNEKESH